MSWLTPFSISTFLFWILNTIILEIKWKSIKGEVLSKYQRLYPIYIFLHIQYVLIIGLCLKVCEDGSCCGKRTIVGTGDETEVRLVVYISSWWMERPFANPTFCSLEHSLNIWIIVYIFTCHLFLMFHSFFENNFLDDKG